MSTFWKTCNVKRIFFWKSFNIFANERIIATKELWAEVSNISKNKSSAITFLDILLFEEYGKVFQNRKYDFYDQELSDESIGKLITNNIDKLRPFLDEKNFAYFWCYRALVGRLSYYIQQIRKTGHVSTPWQQEKGVIEILKPILNEQELEKLINERWDTRTLFGYSETNLAEHLRSLSSGALLSKESLSYSMAISKAAESLRKIEENEKLS